MLEMKLRGMLVAIVTAVFFLGWQVLPLVYGEREKKILPSLSSPSPPFSAFPNLRSLGCSQASKPPSLEPENGRRRTRNEWTDGRTDQQRGERGRARRHFDSLPPPLSLPGSCEIFASFGRGRQGGRSCLLLSSAGMSRKRHSFPLLAWPSPPPRSRSAADCFSFGTPLLKSESRRSRNMAAWRRADWEKE